MKKIILLGASGRTGLAVMKHMQTENEKSENKKYELTAVVRNLEAKALKPFTKDPNITFVKGNVFDKGTLIPTFKVSSDSNPDNSFVISALGFRGRNQEFPKTIKEITEAMKDANQKNLLIVGCQYHKDQGASEPNWFFRFFLQYVIYHPLLDHNRMFNFLESNFGKGDDQDRNEINYLYTCWPGIGNGAPTPNKKMQIEYGTDVIKERGLRRARVTTGDVAKFLFDQIDSGDYKRGEVSICHAN